MAEKLRRRIRARCMAGLARTAGLLPTPLLERALAALAPLSILSRYERTVRSNLELALGASTTQAQRDHIARGVRAHTARLVAEWVRLSRGAAPESPQGAWIEEAVELDPTVAVLERELAKGRGAIVVTAHIGNWELLAARLRRAGHRGVVVGFRRPNDSSAGWIEALRRAYGVETLAQQANPREIVRALRRGLVVGLLADLEVRRLDGEFLPFFGAPALTMSAPAAIARAHGAPILAASCVAPSPGGRYLLAFEPALALDGTLDRRAASVDLSVRLNRVFEGWIRAAPEQWVWHQPRWRSRPGDFEVIPFHARRARVRAARAAQESPSVFTQR